MSAEKSNRVALVTGAAGGIGLATVEVFAEQGWRVIAVDIEDGPDLPEGTRFLRADLSQAEAIEELAAAVEGELHALVNNAAVQVAKPLAEVSLEDWEQTMAVNLRAPWLLSQALLPALKQAGGAVVHVASVHALQTSSELGAYAASKGGLLALTRSMAIEYAPEVRVNAVLPGPVDTEMLRAGLERGGQSRAKLERKVLLQRIAEPAEIAKAIYFLADSEQSSFITGQGLVVDGGATARLSIE